MRTRSACIALAAAAVFILGALITPSVSAATYSSNKDHYHFDYPDNWTSGPSPGSDVVYEGVAVNGYAPNVAATQSKQNQAADHNESWLLSYAQGEFEAVNSSVSPAIIQAPRTYTSASGRLAADYVLEFNDSGVLVRQRSVIYVSDVYNSAVLLALTDNASTFAAQQANWTMIVDSFRFDGEPEIPSDLSITIGGNNSTVIAPNATVRFALNQTLSNNLEFEWFQNGTSVGTNNHVDLTLPGGTYVISVTIANASASQTLSVTVTAGNATGPGGPAPTPYSSSYNMFPLLLLVVVLVAVAALYFLFVRPKKKQPEKPSEGAPPASSSSMQGPPRNL